MTRYAHTRQHVHRSFFADSPEFNKEAGIISQRFHLHGTKQQSAHNSYKNCNDSDPHVLVVAREPTRVAR